MKEELWRRLETFPFDEEGVELSFSERLRRENHWSEEFTARVLDEYRRFLYLCVVAEHPVTPSDAVDQAWHLHLCYTRSYWEDLCRDVLGRVVHHGPTRGGKQEGKKFEDWYETTIRSYAEHFGGVPPTDIWPESKERFRRAQWQRVDRTRSFVVSKGALRLTLLSLGIGLLMVACRERDVYVGLALGWIFLIGAVIFALSKYRGGGGKGGSGCGFFGCGGGDNGCGGGCGD